MALTVSPKLNVIATRLPGGVHYSWVIVGLLSIVQIIGSSIGMAAGVVLRVRPFLYLGAMFVFLGVTSMVWHAQKAIDAVWPWWVFGITAGMLLLAALMAIEKNKSRLREYANSLATWQS